MLDKVIGPALAITAAALIASAVPAHAQSDSLAPAAGKLCAATITACGCTITKPGFYKLGNDLNSSQGLTPSAGCIDIKAPRVVLNAGQPGHQRSDGFNLIGPPGNVFTGIGIHIFRGSNGDFIELPSTLTGWNVGVLVEGNNNIVEDFNAGPFHGAGNFIGVEINGGRNNNLNDFNARNNVQYGVWLRGAGNNQLNCANTDDNQNIGTFVGCSALGVIDAKCKPAVPPSNGNRIYDYSSTGNVTNGIAIDLGNIGNQVSDVGSGGNGGTDFIDENPNCGTNLWFFNLFTTSSQPCID